PRRRRAGPGRSARHAAGPRPPDRARPGPRRRRAAGRHRPPPRPRRPPGDRRPGPGPRGAAMTAPLALWEGSQQAQLEALTAGNQQGLLLRLLEASCVAEFAKLTAARLDLPTWAQTALDVIGEFLPLVGARLRVGPPGLPEFTVAFGAGHHSLSLVTVVEAERLRRQAAAATALSLAASIDEASQEPHVMGLATALAGLPGATGARLNLDSLALGGSLDVRSGIFDGSVPSVCETVTSAGSRLRVELAWADGA